MSEKFGRLIGRNQIADQAISVVELDVSLKNEIDKISVNEGNINTLLGKFENGGSGVLSNAYVPHIAIHGYAGEVNSEAEMLALTQNLNGSAIEAGDTVDRLDLNQTFYFLGGDLTNADNWKQFLTPNEGVTSLRNVSGSVVGQKGIVTLANVAFSGAANDVSFAHADYAATNVEAALVEVMGKAKTNAQDITNINNELSGKVGLAGVYPYVELTGTIDGTNKRFASSVALSNAKVIVHVGGQVMHPSDYSIVGNDVVFGDRSEPQYEYQRPHLMVIKAAA